MSTFNQTEDAREINDHIVGASPQDKELLRKKEEASIRTGKELLDHTIVGELFPARVQKVIYVTSRDSVAAAFKALIDHGILSVPVFDIKSQRYTALVDMLDIVAMCVRLFKENELVEQDLGRLLEASDSFLTEKSASIADLSARNPYRPIESRAPLRSAMEAIVKYAAHRLPVIDNEGELLTILTQSQVVKFLSEHLDKFPSLVSKTIEDLNLGFRDVITIHDTQRAIDAFVLLNEKHVSGLGVVDKFNTLVGNISVSDLKVIGYTGELLHKLFLPITEYLKLIPEGEKRTASGPIVVTPKATFEEVITKLVVSRTHRVYIVTESFSLPVGIITPLEVIKAVLEYRDE